MTDTAIDYGGALQKAIFIRLGAIVAGAGIYQHVPDNTPPPVVIIGDMTPEDQGVKGSVFDRWTISIHTVTKGPQKAPCLALQAQNRGALDQWKPAPANGVVFGRFYQLSAIATLLPDDEMYFGTQTFITTTEPA